MKHMVASNESVMALIRASMDPASHTATHRMDSPACRVVSAAARSDVRAKGAEAVTSLAIGTAVAATALTDVLAGHKGMTAEELLDSLDTVEGADPGTSASLAVTPVVRSLLVKDGMQGSAKLLATIFTRDQAEFYDLIVELGEYAAACIEFLDALKVSSTDETLADLDEMLQDFARS